MDNFLDKKTPQPTISNLPSTDIHQHDAIDSLPVSPQNLSPWLIHLVDDATVAPIPTSVNGTLYFEYDGANLTLWFRANQMWFQLAGPGSGATPGGPEGAVQFNNGGNFDGNTGLLYNNITDTLEVNKISTATTLSNNLSIEAVGNMTVSADGSGSSELDLLGVAFVTLISAAGGMLISAQGTPASNGSLRLKSTHGNLSFGAEATSPNYGGGAGVFFLENCTTAPTTTPSGGGLLYSSAGALHWLGSSGTDTVIAPA